jgi:hypothetical protein
MIDATCKAEDWHRPLSWYYLGLASCVRWTDWHWAFDYGSPRDSLIGNAGHQYPNVGLVRYCDPLPAPLAGPSTPDKGEGRE